MIEELFKENNLKITNQRKKIINTIIELNDKATIKNIINKNKDIDQSTIYRTIEILINNNIIEKDINYNEEVYYYIKEKHTHYITCIKCHKKEKIDICPIHEVETKLENNGYEIIDHKLEIKCICKKCR